MNECVSWVACGNTTTAKSSATVPNSVSLSSYRTIGRPERNGQRAIFTNYREEEENTPPLVSDTLQETEIVNGLRLSPWKFRGALGP